MIDPELLAHGIPNLGEAIPIDIYSELTGQHIDRITSDIKSRKLLGVFHQGAWYVEAPAFCEEKLREIVLNRRKIQKARQEEDDEKAERERKRRAELADREKGRQEQSKQRDSRRQWENFETQLGYIKSILEIYNYEPNKLFYLQADIY